MTETQTESEPGVSKPPEIISTSHVQVQLELEEHILRGKKIKDEDLIKMKDQVGDANAKWVSPCYSVKDLWGIPKQFQRALLNLNKYNCNKTLGFKIIN